MRTVKLTAVVIFFIATAVTVQPSPAYSDNIRDSQWYLQFLSVTEAHKYSQGEGMRVALIDTGVNPNHPDLRGNILKGIETTPGNTGRDGRRDNDGHGTKMAGIIAAHGHGPDAGILGIAPKAKILPIRDTDTYGFGSDAGEIAGIDWAIANNADVISIASGGAVTSTLRAAVERARKANIVIVAAAGNRPDAVFVGAAAAIEGVVAAAATDRNGNHASVSVTGKQIVLAAPGVDITGTSQNGGYRTGTGTSDATAIIAGAVALVRAKYPDLPADEVIHRLTATATDKGPPGRDEEYGFGVLNLVAALTANVAPAAEASVPPTGGGPTASAPSGVAAPTTEPTSSSGRTTATVALVVLLAFLAAGGTMWLIVKRRSRTS